MTCSSGLVSSLNLGFNSLSGSIPAELGDLRSLTSLYLTYNSLSGIPAELGNLANLNRLALSNNSLTGNIPAELGNLENLTSLDLSSNSLSGSIPAELGKLTNLTSLSLGFNSLSGSIPAELGDLRSLTSLYLTYNSLSGIPAELGNLANLNRLALSNNSLTGNIPAELGNLENLTSLDLSSNSLSGSIPAELGKLTNLTSLSLGFNSLSGSIPAELGDLRSLTSLYLTYNSLSGIPAELGNLANLNRLALSNNSLTGNIPAELGNLENLTSLDLSSNSLSGSIPAELGNLTNLTSLSLGSNSLSGSIPAELGDLRSLTSLYLTYNSLSGIPAELGNLANLNRLWLSNNSLAGNIPAELGDLENLTSLDLSSNSLSGSIPAELGKLTNLTSLSLGFNSLSGSIPAELGDLRSLTSLYLTYNSLSGIPAELGNLANLNRLWLSNNSLTGNIPAELGNLENLTSLDLSSNSLSGSIPAELGKLTNLTSLNLGFNSLSGSIPAELGDLRSLTSLYLNYNSLTGPMPQWLIDMEIPYVSVIKAFNSEVSNVFPIVAISEGSRTITDTDGAAGELVSFTGSAADDDGTIATTQWLVDGAVVATGTSANLHLVDGVTEVTFRATDNDGDSTSRSVSIIVEPPDSIITFIQGADEGEYLFKLYSDDLGTNSHTLKFAFTYTSTGLNYSKIIFSGNSSSAVSASAINGNGTVEITASFTSSADSSKPFATVIFLGEGGGTFDLEITKLLIDDKTINFDDPPNVNYDITIVPEVLNIKMDEDTSYSSIFQPYGSAYAYWTMLSVGAKPSHGEVTISENSLDNTEWTYSPTDNFFGTDQFSLIATNRIDGRLRTLDVSLTIEPVNDLPVSVILSNDEVISGGSRTISDTDGAAGESVSFTGTATDSDGTIAATQWLVEGSEVATGLTATIALPNGSTVVTFKATDSDGATTSATVTITVEQQNLSPSVTISGGNRTISDTDGIAGETVSFKGAANDGDGTVATTQWFVDGSEVATGLIATIALPNGSTDITFKATDDDGASSTTTATITVASPTYEPTEDWPSPYNGVTPDLSYGLEFNNVGVLNSSDTTIYVCLRIFTDGLPSSVSGISQFDMGLEVVSLSDATVQITKFREFNAIGALNENAQTPDCSGIFETTTGIYTDIIVAGDSVLDTTWSLIDPTNLILKLDSFKELTAN